MWGETTYVVARKIIYMGPPSDRQLEGRLALTDAPHTALLMGTEPLPWHDAARLLQAAQDGTTEMSNGPGRTGENAAGSDEGVAEDGVPASA